MSASQVSGSAHGFHSALTLFSTSATHGIHLQLLLPVVMEMLKSGPQPDILKGGSEIKGGAKRRRKFLLINYS